MDILELCKNRLSSGNMPPNKLINIFVLDLSNDQFVKGPNMEDKNRIDYLESVVSCGDHIVKKIYKSIRICLVFPEKVIGIIPLSDTDEVSGYILKDNLIFKDKWVRIQSLGNTVFMENLTGQNNSHKILKFYVILEDCTFAITAINHGSYPSSDHQIHRFIYR